MPKLFPPKSFCLILLFSSIIMSGSLFAQTSSEELKKLTMEELMNIEVTSVSKRPEKLTEVASAIQVITQEDIRRSGATSLPEALRLAPNLQVAQYNSYGWIISARGFNGIFSNKLLVMINGRTVYSPLFAGVSWDAQSVLLEDIERIEVVSGPGGTLWGANAVNGVINIITKKAEKTEGLYATAALGTYLKDYAALRYGGEIGDDISYRVYGQRSDRNNTFLPNGEDNSDEWGFTQAGFRMDWAPSAANDLTLEGNFYGGKEQTIPSASTIDGQNVLGRWSHTFSARSGLLVQAYFDRTWRRDIPSALSDELETYDIEFQHHFKIKERHKILWGGGYRFMHNNIINDTIVVGYVPQQRDMNTYSGFIQDEITLIPHQLQFTIGSKLQHNIFTGFEIQPSARLAWMPTSQHTIWSAVSRAVRTPSRIDVDYHIPTFPVPPDQPSVAGGPNFISETVIAYELGYRVRPGTNLSLSLATFYNRYDNLHSVEAIPGTLTYLIQNGTEGRSWGTEISGTWQILKDWRLRGGYTYFNKDLDSKTGMVKDFSNLGNDANHLALLQSMANLPGNFQLDMVFRYIGALPAPYIPDYFTFDARLAWVYKHWELSVVGQNLWEDRHQEFGLQIPRSIYGKVTCRF